MLQYTYIEGTFVGTQVRYDKHVYCLARHIFTKTSGIFKRNVLILLQRDLTDFLLCSAVGMQELNKDELEIENISLYLCLGLHSILDCIF